MVLVAVPICNNFGHNNIPDTISSLERRHVGAVAVRGIGLEAFCGAKPDGRLIEVADRAQHHRSIQIDAPGVINWRKERGRLEAFLSRMPFRVPLDRPVASLAAGEKQKLEILKLLYLDQRFLILDEPTSVLTPAEADEILGPDDLGYLFSAYAWTYTALQIPVGLIVDRLGVKWANPVGVAAWSLAARSSEWGRSGSALPTVMSVGGNAGLTWSVIDHAANAGSSRKRRWPE